MTLATSRRALAVLLSVSVLMTSLSVSLGARPLKRTRTWDELPVIITNQLISLILPDRTRLRGVVREVRADTLVLDVRRSSNRRLHPMGRNEVPRASVSNIEMYLRGHSGLHRGSAIGAAVGVVAMSPIVLAIGDANLAPEWVGVVALLAGIVGGAILGHRLLDDDEDYVQITVIPAPPPPATDTALLGGILRNRRC